MKTYWDYTEKERAYLTNEQVTALLDVELMEAGVLKPSAPTLTPIENVPVGGKVKYFGIVGKSRYGSDEPLGICFPNIDAAQKFLELSPLVRDYDYEVGSEFSYAKALVCTAIQSEELYEVQQINSFRSALKQRKSAAEENERLKTQFSAACAKSESVTKGVWDDWYKCLSRNSTLKGIVETFKSYVKLTGGDEQMALTFLRKAHNGDDINEAREWFPDEIVTEVTEIAKADEPMPA